MRKKISKLLYLSFDEKLDPDEQGRLEKALTESKALKEEQKRILEMRNIISTTTADSFKPFFAERVMKRILHEKQKTFVINNLFDSLLSVFRPLSLVTLLVIIVILAYNLGTGDSFSLDSAFGIPEYTIENIANAIQ
jgi:hypothetical protein